MKCKEVQNKLFDYIDQDLSEKEMILIHEHILHCSECNSVYSKLKASWNELKEDKIPYQPFFYTRLKQKLENRESRKSNRMRIARAVLQPAMYFVILGLGIFIGIQLGKGVDNPTGQTARFETNEYIEYYKNQFMTTSHIDTIEQQLLNAQNINNDE